MINVIPWHYSKQNFLIQVIQHGWLPCNAYLWPRTSFFAGGMVNVKNIGQPCYKVCSMSVISVIWFRSFSLSFGDSIYGVIGNPFTYFNFKGVTPAPNEDFGATILFIICLFQLKLPLLHQPLAGSFAEWFWFRSYILYMLLFTLIYSPLAHGHHLDGLFRKWSVEFWWNSCAHVMTCCIIWSICWVKKKNWRKTSKHPICYSRYWFIMVWLVWFNAGLH